MRLPPPLIELVARRTIQSLLTKGVISSNHPERTIEKVARLIAADLAVEDQITEEARLIIMQAMDRTKSQEDIEFHRLLLKVKAELAAKRGYVL
jgi:hypothetical protein